MFLEVDVPHLENDIKKGKNIVFVPKVCLKLVLSLNFKKLFFRH